MVLLDSSDTLQDERLLVRRAKEGDPVAFDTLVELHWAPLLSLATARLRRSDEAEDAVLRAMTKAFVAIGGFEEGRPVRPWLAAIVINCCTDAVRRRREDVPFPERFEELRAGSDDVAAIVEAESLARAAREAIARLPRHYAEAMTLRVMDDLPVEEIALRMHRPVGTIKSWLFRARAMLARSLRPALG